MKSDAHPVPFSPWEGLVKNNNNNKMFMGKMRPKQPPVCTAIAVTFLVKVDLAKISGDVQREHLWQERHEAKSNVGLQKGCDQGV